MATLAHLEAILRSAGENYHRLALTDTASALITQRGGRILGIFPTLDSDNLLWINSAAFDTVTAFQEFVGAGHWNLGGERIWIAPEIQYNVRDRQDFWGTLHVPPQMDPGLYQLDASLTEDGQPAGVRLSAEIVLTAHTIATGEQRLSIERTIVPVTNPLAALSQSEAWMQEVVFCGYKQRVMLDGKHTTAFSEAWNLVQVKAGGELIIPCAPSVEASDYFGSVPDETRQIHYGAVPHLRLHITGQRQYKIGYKAASMTGRMGYIHTLPDGRAYLLIRAFFNNPSNLYAEEPPDLPGNNGHSVHVYNDGGELGGAASFGEMECSGHTVHGKSREGCDKTANDTFVMWAYVGAPDSIQRIAHLLLGVKV
jgi:hypothetical protein